MTGFRDRQDFKDLRDERPNIFDLVGTRPQNDDRKTQPLHVLLSGQIAVDSHKNLIEPAKPAAGTVVTSWPGNSRASRLGRHSSRTTFMPERQVPAPPWYSRGKRSPDHGSPWENPRETHRSCIRLPDNRSDCGPEPGFPRIPASPRESAGLCSPRWSQRNNTPATRHPQLRLSSVSWQPTTRLPSAV